MRTLSLSEGSAGNRTRESSSVVRGLGWRTRGPFRRGIRIRPSIDELPGTRPELAARGCWSVGRGKVTLQFLRFQQMGSGDHVCGARVKAPGACSVLPGDVSNTAGKLFRSFLRRSDSNPWSHAGTGFGVVGGDWRPVRVSGIGLARGYRSQAQGDVTLSSVLRCPPANPCCENVPGEMQARLQEDRCVSARRCGRRGAAGAGPAGAWTLCEKFGEEEGRKEGHWATSETSWEMRPDDLVPLLGHSRRSTVVPFFLAVSPWLLFSGPVFAGTDCSQVTNPCAAAGQSWFANAFGR